MIKYILAGTAATVVAVTVGIIVLKKDLACEYSPINLSSIIDCEAVQTRTAASTEVASQDTTQNDDVSPKAGSQEIEQKPAEDVANTDVAETEKASEEAQVAEQTNVPTFDIVRVEADGSTLVAGRSAPNSKIILKDGDKNIGETTASDAGEWVIIVDEPIQAATASLSLLAMLPDGTSVESTATVDIAMRNEAAENATAEAKPLIKLADAAGQKADEIIAKTDDAAKQTIDTATEAGDKTSKAVEETVAQAEQLAKEAAALLKKAANKTAQAAKVEAAPIVEKVAEVTETIVETATETMAQPIVETVEKVVETMTGTKVAEVKVAEPKVEAMVKEVVEPVAETKLETVVEVAAKPIAEVMPEIATETEEFILKEPTAETVSTETMTAETMTAKTAKPETTETKPQTQDVTAAKAVEKTAKVAVKATEKLVAKTAPAEDKTPLVVISEKGKATKILQGAGGKNNEMTFNSMDYNEKGEIIFSGDAKPNEMVRVYINNEFIGESIADGSGRWSLDKGYVMQAGPNSMRFDQVDAAGTVISRRETSITMPKLAQVVKSPAEETVEAEAKTEKMTAETTKAVEPNAEVKVAAKTNDRKTTITAVKIAKSATNKTEVIQTKGGRAIIIWGDNLWNISRKIYGKGELYTTIFKANKDQIRNPDLIYPGQVFLLPDNIEIK